MTFHRQLFVGLGLTVILAITGCDSSSNSAPSTSASTSADGSHLPRRGPPIPGLDAATILDAARAVLPEAEELTFRHGPITSRAYTESKIGYPDPNAADITRGTPSVHVTWEDDGTVVFVACTDLVAAGATSPVVAGPAIAFTISGAPQSAPSATASSDL